MAELQVQAGKSRHSGALRQRKKLSTRIDLTPMVDLGFLLITFFIITTTWSESKAMKFYLPAGESPDMPTPESTVLTVVPLKDDRIFYYHGDLANALQHTMYGITGYNIDHGIGDIIRNKIRWLNSYGKPGFKNMMLIIKPTGDASYKNVVDVMDEVLINDVKHYAVTDISTTESEAIAALKLQ